jgi:hypothetical protein
MLNSVMISCIICSLLGYFNRRNIRCRAKRQINQNVCSGVIHYFRGTSSNVNMLSALELVSRISPELSPEYFVPRISLVCSSFFQNVC